MIPKQLNFEAWFVEFPQTVQDELSIPVDHGDFIQGQRRFKAAKMM